MKICIVTTNFPRWPGDLRVPFIYEASLALQRQGCQVRVIATHNPGAKTHEWMDGIEVIRPRYLPDRFEVLQRDTAGMPAAWKKNPWARLAVLPYMLVQALAVARWTRGCDIIHANWTLSAWLAWATQWIHRRPYIITVQGSDIFQAPKIPLVAPLTRRALNGAKRVLALSCALAEATRRLGVSAGKITRMPNGVSLEHFPSPPEGLRGPLLLFTGSLIERKGPIYLIRAFPQVLEQHPDARLVLVGEGTQQDELVQTVRLLGLDKKVTFTGTQSQAQVGEWMRKARLFILPSLEEGQGVVLVEALASGTPCIGSAVGGIPDVVTPEVGRLVPPENSEALAAAIHELLQDDELWLKLSRQARQRAEQEYDWDVIAGRIMEIYQS
jgi:glycosyltransferase involved in cell wall biosynthesis